MLSTTHDPLEDTMNEFTATHFRFEVEALTTLAFDDYTGSALRGALVTALQHNFCPVRDQADAAHQAICPVCWLLSHEATPGDSRRPYAIEPLLGERRYFIPGERFQFGLTLFGQAVNLFPYLVLAVPRMGNDGIGRKLDHGERGTWHRGRFVLRSISEVNPLTGVRRTLMGEGQQMVQTPQHPVTSGQVQNTTEQVAQRMQANGGQLSLRFLTPTRIVHEKKLMHEPHFRPLFQRLLERVNELQRTFGQAVDPPAWQELLALADQVQLLHNQAPWWDVQGRSSRLEREQQLGGFVGQADYGAPVDVWPSLLPWLIWGMSTHVGKNAVKGSGWYSLVDQLTVNGEQPGQA
jgi:hypothetical protein